MEVSSKIIGFLPDTSDWREILCSDDFGGICWCRWIEVPLSQEILYTQLFGATTWKVLRFMSLGLCGSSKDFVWAPLVGW